MGINLERQKKSWTLNEVITNLSDTSTAQDFASSMEKIDNKLNEIKKEIRKAFQMNENKSICIKFSGMQLEHL